MAEVILGIMKRSIVARHAIQNKFAQLHGRIVGIKERNKRIFSAASALNFTGSISPVRIPEFEADMNKLSRLSSPIGMEEIGQKYSNIEAELEDECKNEETNSEKYQGNHDIEHFPYDHNDGGSPIINSPIQNDAAVKLIIPRTPSKKSSENQTDQTNFPAVISPMKRPQKDIEAEGKHT